MSEHALWGTVRDRLARDGVWDRVENRVLRGMADTNYLVKGVEGWVELKHRDAWPARAGGTVTLEHFTSWQREWLRTRWLNGGHAYMLLYIQRARTYLLFDGFTASQIVGLDTRAEHERVALVIGHSAFPTEELKAILYVKRPGN